MSLVTYHCSTAGHGQGIALSRLDLCDVLGLLNCHFRANFLQKSAPLWCLPLRCISGANGPRKLCCVSADSSLCVWVKSRCGQLHLGWDAPQAYLKTDCLHGVLRCMQLQCWWWVLDTSLSDWCVCGFGSVGNAAAVLLLRLDASKHLGMWNAPVAPYVAAARHQELHAQCCGSRILCCFKGLRTHT